MPNSEDSTEAGHRQPSESAGVPRWVMRTGLATWLGVGVILFSGFLVIAIAATKAFVLPIVFAGWFAALLMPSVDGLEARNLRRSVGAAAALLLVAVLGVVLLWIFAAGIASQTAEIGVQIDKALERVQSIFADLNIDGDFVDDVASGVGSAGPSLRDGLTGSLIRGLGGVASLLAGLVIAAISLFYFLRDGHRFGEWAFQHVDPRNRDEMVAIGRHAAASIRHYTAGQSVVGLVNAVFIAGGAALLGVPLIPSIAVLTFVGGFIPYLGTFFAGAFAILLALAQGGLTAAWILLGVMLFTQNVVEPFVEARAVGSSLGLHPLVAFLATTLGGILAGIPGLILAAPLTSIVVFAGGRMRELGFFR